MTCQDFIDNQLRPRVHDPDRAGYSDAELLTILEAALLALYGSAASLKKGPFVKGCLVTHYGRVPSDFGGFCGQYPVKQESGRFRILSGESFLEARYHPTPPQSLGLESEIPLPLKFFPLLLDLCAVRALNRNEFDTSQDQAITSSLMETLAGMLE
jgi:hypothetical protein